MNMNNILICYREHLGPEEIFHYVLKLSDIEVSEFFRINFSDLDKNDFKVSYLNMYNFNDYHNFKILLLQFIFYVKNLSFKTIFEYEDMFQFYKLEEEVLSAEMSKIISEDPKLFYFSLLIDELNKKNENEICELNELFQNIISLRNINFEEMKLSKEKIILLLLSTVEISENIFLEYVFLNLFKIKNANSQIFVSIFEDYTYLNIFMSKYINFIQLHYSKHKEVDFLDLIEYIISIKHSKEDLTKVRVCGLFPLILSYVSNCQIDFQVVISILKKYALNNTMTIVTVIEKVNFNNPLIVFMEKLFLNNKKDENFDILKGNLISLLHILKYFFFHNFSLDYLKNARKFLSKDQIFNIVKYFPIIFRKKEFMTEIQKLLSTIIDENIDFTQNDFRSFFSCLFSLILYKKNLKCSFLYSVCLSQTLMRDLTNVIFMILKY
jgi:hypothetical protein